MLSNSRRGDVTPLDRPFVCVGKLLLNVPMELAHMLAHGPPGAFSVFCADSVGDGGVGTQHRGPSLQWVADTQRHSVGDDVQGRDEQFEELVTGSCRDGGVKAVVLRQKILLGGQKFLHASNRVGYFRLYLLRCRFRGAGGELGLKHLPC